MPFWFVILAVLAATGLLGSYSSGFVTSSIMFSLGLMIPVWILAVNLWWIVLVLAPWAWMAARGRPVRGFLI